MTIKFDKEKEFSKQQDKINQIFLTSSLSSLYNNNNNTSSLYQQYRIDLSTKIIKKCIESLYTTLKKEFSPSDDTTTTSNSNNNKDKETMLRIKSILLTSIEPLNKILLSEYHLFDIETFHILYNSLSSSTSTTTSSTTTTTTTTTSSINNNSSIIYPSLNYYPLPPACRVTQSSKPPEFYIRIRIPSYKEMKKKGMLLESEYIVYLIKTRIWKIQYDNNNNKIFIPIGYCEQEHRYNDFKKLNILLKKYYSNEFIPDLPSRSLLQMAQQGSNLSSSNNDDSEGNNSPSSVTNNSSSSNNTGSSNLSSYISFTDASSPHPSPLHSKVEWRRRHLALWLEHVTMIRNLQLSPYLVEFLTGKHIEEKKFNSNNQQANNNASIYIWNSLSSLTTNSESLKKFDSLLNDNENEIITNYVFSSSTSSNSSSNSSSEYESSLIASERIRSKRDIMIITKELQHLHLIGTSLLNSGTSLLKLMDNRAKIMEDLEISFRALGEGEHGVVSNNISSSTSATSSFFNKLSKKTSTLNSNSSLNYSQAIDINKDPFVILSRGFKRESTFPLSSYYSSLSTINSFPYTPPSSPTTNSIPSPFTRTHTPPICSFVETIMFQYDIVMNSSQEIVDSVTKTLSLKALKHATSTSLASLDDFNKKSSSPSFSTSTITIENQDENDDEVSVGSTSNSVGIDGEEIKQLNKLIKSWDEISKIRRGAVLSSLIECVKKSYEYHHEVTQSWSEIFLEIGGDKDELNDILKNAKGKIDKNLFSSSTYVRPNIHTSKSFTPYIPSYTSNFASSTTSGVSSSSSSSPYDLNNDKDSYNRTSTYIPSHSSSNNSNPKSTWNYIKAMIQKPLIPRGSRKKPTVYSHSSTSSSSSPTTTTSSTNSKQSTTNKDSNPSFSSPTPKTRHQAPSTSSTSSSTTSSSTTSSSTSSSSTSSSSSHASDFTPQFQSPPPTQSHFQSQAQAQPQTQTQSQPQPKKHHIPRNIHRTTNLPSDFYGQAPTPAATASNKAATGTDKDYLSTYQEEFNAQQQNLKQQNQQYQQQNAQYYKYASAPPSSSTASQTLPPGWTKHETEDGTPYYYHARAQVSLWEFPTMEKTKIIEEKLRESEEKAKSKNEKKESTNSTPSTSSTSSTGSTPTSTENTTKLSEEDEKAKKISEIAPKLKKAIISWSQGKNLASLLNTLHNIISFIPEGTIVPLDKQLDKNSTFSEIKKAYLKSARLLHPDKLPSDLIFEERLLVDEVFILLTNAYTKLRDENEK